MNHLAQKNGGNIHDNGTIEITSNTINSSDHPKNLVEYDNDKRYDPNGSQYHDRDALVCFDFKDKLVQLTDYSIRSHTFRFLKNWNLEISNDGKKWEVVYRHENDLILIYDKHKVASFLETGPCWANDIRYDGDLTMIEFFGTLQQPHLK